MIGYTINLLWLTASFILKPILVDILASFLIAYWRVGPQTPWVVRLKRRNL